MKSLIVLTGSPYWLGASAIGLFVLIVSSVLTLLLVKWTGRFGLIDQPSEIKIHSQPTPRSGGIAIMISLIAGCALCHLLFQTMPVRSLLLLLPTFFIFIIGLLDDRLGLRASLKLALTCLSALAVTIQIPGISVGVAIVVSVAMGLLTNAINLLDGANGLAGGVMLLVFAALGILFAMNHDSSAALLSFLTALSILGFLVFNLGGRIFMGDCGSLMLGLLAATMVLRSYSYGTHVLLGAVLCTAVPLLDLFFVIGRRIYRRAPLLSGDLNHGYNLLLRKLGHLRLVLAAYYSATILSIALGLLIAGG